MLNPKSDFTLDDFLNRRDSKNIPKSVKQARAYRAKLKKFNPQKLSHQDRKANLKYKYNLTIQEWDKLFEKQDGKCAICRYPMKRPVVDHDHDTNRVRGLLCNSCNVALAKFCDSIELLNRAIIYLQK